MKAWKVALMVLALASCTTVFLMKRGADAHFREQQRAVAKLAQMTFQLRAENERLSNQLAQIAKPAARTDRETEAASLRAEFATLQQEKNEREKQNLRNAEAAITARPGAGSAGPNADTELNAFAAAKLRDANLIAVVVAKYPFQHDGQFPTNLSEAAALMTNNTAGRQWTATNDFELIYRGTRESWGNIPWGAVAIVRERQPWKAPSGKWARVYGMGDGSSQVIESDDNFQSWEGIHFIPPAMADGK